MSATFLKTDLSAFRAAAFAEFADTLDQSTPTMPEDVTRPQVQPAAFPEQGAGPEMVTPTEQLPPPLPQSPAPSPPEPGLSVAPAPAPNLTDLNALPIGSVTTGAQSRSAINDISQFGQQGVTYDDALAACGPAAAARLAS